MAARPYAGRSAATGLADRTTPAIDDAIGPKKIQGLMAAIGLSAEERVAPCLEERADDSPRQARAGSHPNAGGTLPEGPSRQSSRPTRQRHGLRCRAAGMKPSRAGRGCGKK